MTKKDWFMGIVYFLMIICGFLSGLAGHFRIGLILFVLAVIVFYGGKAWRIKKGDKIRWKKQLSDDRNNISY